MVFKLEDVKSLAREVGFDLCGVAQCREFEQDRVFLEGWLEEGFGGSLDYLKKNIALRADASSLVEGARSVVVCALAYKNAVSDGYSCDARGKVASYALTTDYHRTIKDMLFEMCRRLKALDDSFVARCLSTRHPYSRNATQ